MVESIFLVVAVISYRLAADNSKISPLWMISGCEFIYSIPQFTKYLILLIYGRPEDYEAPTYIIIIPLLVFTFLCFFFIDKNKIIIKNVDRYEDD